MTPYPDPPVRPNPNQPNPIMAEDPVLPLFRRHVAELHRKQRYALPTAPPDPGELADPVKVSNETASRMAMVVAKHAAGLSRSTKRTEVLWGEADGQLAVGVGGLEVKADTGTVAIMIPVRCEEAGSGTVTVTFAVGDAERPAGMFAATERRPCGPRIVVDAWGEALVAFAWQILLGVATDLAAAVGADSAGDRLVPAQVTATNEGLEVLPMGRHRLGTEPPKRESRKRESRTGREKRR